MIISLKKSKLFQTLSYANKFISSKILSSPTLQGVCFRISDKTLEITSSNLNQFYCETYRIKNPETGLFIVEPKKLIEFLSLLPGDEVILKLSKNKIEVTQGKIQGEFSLINDIDYPQVPKTKNNAKKLNKGFFKELLPFLLFAASGDETRPILTGVNFVRGSEGFILVATDGFRLSLLKVKEDFNFNQVIIPSKFLVDVGSCLEEEEVFFGYLTEEKMVFFRENERVFYSRTIDGEFPPYEKVIPEEKNTRVVLDKEEFLRNIKLVSVFAKEFSNVVILEFKDNTVFFYPKTQDKLKPVCEQEVELIGSEIQVAFNYRFLVDFLLRVKDSQIMIDLLREDSPVVFRPKNQTDRLHVIMPVRIQY